MVPSPASTVSPADLESFRAFAPQIEAAVESRSVDFFVGIAQISTYVCPDGIEPRCEDEPEGTIIEGIWLGRWRSDAALFTTERFGEVLGNWLAPLSDPTLYALAGLATFRSISLGGPSFFAVVSSPQDTPVSALVFDFVREEGDWHLLGVIEAPVLAEEWLSGECTRCYDHWERWEGTP